MAILLDRIDAVPIVNSDFDVQFLQWLWVLVDNLNENILDIQNALNFLTPQNVAILTETVTLTMGSPSFNVANGSLYSVGDNVIGNGIPATTNIIGIIGNTLTLDATATINGASQLKFIPIQGAAVSNGILLYDTTNNVYVGMQNGSLVKFTTAAYP